MTTHSDLPSPLPAGTWEPEYARITQMYWECEQDPDSPLGYWSFDSITGDLRAKLIRRTQAAVAELDRQRAAAGVVEVRREIVSLFGQYALAQALIEALLNDDERDPLSSDVGEEINAAVKGLHEITEQLEALSPELFVLAAAQEQQES